MKRIFITISFFIVAIIIAARVGYHIRQAQETNRPATQETQPSSVQAAGKGLKAGMIDPKTGKKIKYWVAPMDPTYIRNEPGKSPMGMDLVPVYEEAGEEKLPSSTIRIDPVTIQNMGVRLAQVQRKPLVKTIRTYGNITYDETKIYAVNVKFNGWIEKLYVDFEGTRVKKGQPLFDIYSPELVSAQEEYLLARQQYDSLSSSPYPGVRDAAERLMAAAKTRLRYWDLTDKQIKEIEIRGAPRKTLTIFSPAAGVVIKKIAFEGHQVKAGEHLYEIADLSKVWVDVDIYEYELPWVKVGMEAEMELPYVPGRRFQGRVLFVYPYLNPKTRTVTLRLEFSNPADELKPNMYADIYLRAKIDGESLVVPEEAVIDSGTRKLVFVALGKGRFEPREVEVGAEGNNSEFQILSGVHEGEEVVVSAQFLLDSESRLREAIEKMRSVKPPAGAEKSADTGAKAEKSGDDLDMSGLTMDSMADDDLDMTGISMDSTPEAPAPGRSSPNSGAITGHDREDHRVFDQE